MPKKHPPHYDAAFKCRAAEQDVIIAQQKNRISELERQVAELKARVENLTKMLFGKKSEKSKKDKEKKPKSSPDRPYNVFDVQPNQTAAPIYSSPRKI